MVNSRVVALVALLLIAAKAAKAVEMLDRTNSSCHFYVHKGGKWEPVSNNRVSRGTFIRKSPSKTAGMSMAKVEGTWYSFPDSCAVEWDRHVFDPKAIEFPWFVELSGILLKPQGDEVNGSTSTDDSGFTTVTTPYKALPGFGIQIGKRLNREQSVTFLYHHFGGTQSSSLDGAGQTATSEIAENFNFFGFAFRHQFFEFGDLHFYFEPAVGYGMASRQLRVSGFTILYSGFNGDVDISGSTLWYALRLTTEWKLGDRFGMVGIVGYEQYPSAEAKVNTTTTALFTEGETVKFVAASWYTFGLNLQYSF